jgi:NADPH-dependent curcumin reductase CurA
MIGGTVGVVVASRNVDWPEGTAVVGNLGWQSHAISDGRGLRRLDPRVPPQAHLGVCGMPGVTAHLGLLEFGRPRAGETVVVSAAAGAVGSIVGQIAKLHGARAVGIAGGPAKIRHVVEELGFDACVDHRAPDFEEALARATPDGIDVNFENVGGRVMAAVLSRMNPFSRMPLCGLVSEYDGSSPSASSFAPILAKRIAVRGFIVSDHLDHWPAALDALATWVAAGTLRHHETVFEGLPRAPEALIAMLRGENVGKMLVRISSPSA